MQRLWKVKNEFSAGSAFLKRSDHVASLGFVHLTHNRLRTADKAPDHTVILLMLTGGDAERLMALGARGWEHVPQLTMIGLNEIMTYNEK